MKKDFENKNVVNQSDLWIFWIGIPVGVALNAELNKSIVAINAPNQLKLPNLMTGRFKRVML